MSKVMVMNHPLISHKLAMIRNKDTKSTEFRQLVSEIASLMTFDMARNLKTKKVLVETPITTATCEVLDKDIILVPILRAGLGMVDGISNLIPSAKIGHIGLYRDEETLEPHEYFAKYPKNLDESVVMIVDPMLATGGSANAAITMVKKQGAKNIRLVCLVGAPEGVQAVEKMHPDVDIYLAALDEKLNEKGYIVPGLGDAGDRIFGTK